jgi:metal-responsive CopG/Arc/MetJ family transcriptional regulator
MPTPELPLCAEDRTSVILSGALNEQLDTLAKSTGIPKAEHVRRAIREYIALNLKKELKAPGVIYLPTSNPRL